METFRGGGSAHKQFCGVKGKRRAYARRFQSFREIELSVGVLLELLVQAPCPRQALT